MEKKIIGNIFGSIAALIGIWRFFEVLLQFQWIVRNGLVESSLPFARLIQGRINSLYLQGVLFMAVGVGLIIWANVKSNVKHHHVNSVKHGEEWELIL